MCRTCKCVVQLLGQLALLGLLELEAGAFEGGPSSMTAAPWSRGGREEWLASIMAVRERTGSRSIGWGQAGVAGFRPEALAPMTHGGPRLLMGEAAVVGGCWLGLFRPPLHALPLHIPKHMV